LTNDGSFPQTLLLSKIRIPSVLLKLVDHSFSAASLFLKSFAKVLYEIHAHVAIASLSVRVLP